MLAQPKVKRLVSGDHFSVDGTLIEAWASIKSFRRKDGSDDDGHGPAATRSATSPRRSGAQLIDAIGAERHELDTERGELLGGVVELLSAR